MIKNRTAVLRMTLDIYESQEEALETTEHKVVCDVGSIKENEEMQWCLMGLRQTLSEAYKATKVIVDETINDHTR